MCGTPQMFTCVAFHDTQPPFVMAKVRNGECWQAIATKANTKCV